jgi:hypothetical protein
MTIVDYQIWLFHSIMTYPQSSNTIFVHFIHIDGRSQVAMAQHAESEERVSHLFREEDTSDIGWDIGEGISHTPDDYVLKDGGTLHEWRLVLPRSKPPLLDEVIRQLKNWSRPSRETS